MGEPPAPITLAPWVLLGGCCSVHGVAMPASGVPESGRRGQMPFAGIDGYSGGPSSNTIRLILSSVCSAVRLRWL